MNRWHEFCDTQITTLSYNTGSLEQDGHYEYTEAEFNQSQIL